MKKEILPEQIWNEEKMEGVKKLIQKQKLIEIIKSDEELGLYEAFKNIPEPNDKLKKAFRDFSKTETLEQAAERLYSDKFYPMYGSIRRDAFINGAEWYQEQHDFLPGLIKQFDPKEGEINGEQWTAVHFLKWLELNKFKIVK